MLPTLDPVEAVVTDPPYGLEFMGQAWDHGVPGVPYWAAVRDALHPGGYLLAFGGTRTHHRLMVGIEDAGFEIRDVIMWVYGSGFPKSHDVGKGIDKEAGAQREVIGVRQMTGYGKANVTNGQQQRFTTEFPQTSATPATDAATQWDGWGTALKPAWDPIIIARRPLDGTVAQNVLAHGVGGINIGGCRVGNTKDVPATMPRDRSGHGRYGAYKVHTGGAGQDPNVGRWPANLIHDGSDEVGRLLPARSFYCAKAAQSDRHEGIATGRNTHPTVKPLPLMRYLVRLVTPPGGTVLDPFMGSGSTGKAADLEGCGFVGIDQDAEACRLAAHRRRPQQALPL